MVDLEAVGGAATGGLIGSTFETPAGKAGEHHNACADCGTETIGRFCHNCGNASHVHRTLLHLGEELLHGVMHFDSRTWRTLPRLVFRPGQLTRDWCLGKRARYVSPLALFLFTVFVLFMALSYLPASPEMSRAEAQAQAAGRLAQQRTALAEAQASVRAATTPEAQAEAAGEVRSAEREVAEALKTFQDLKAEPVARISNGEDTVNVTWNMNGLDRTKVNTGNKKLDEKIRHKLENPELALYKLQQTFYKFSFLLIPISIPFVALLFLWKRGFTFYDHGVFVLYSLTFMSLLVMAFMAVNRIGGGVQSIGVVLLPCAVPAHMFFQLKGAYGLGVFSALWRTFFLLIFCAIALVVFLLAILYVGMA